MHRRSFLHLAGAVAGAPLALGATACRPRAAPAGGGRRLGVQLYTVRALLAEDFAGTLREIARIGYQEVELAGLHGRAPRAVRAMLDEARLAAPAGHASLEALRADASREAAAAHALGHEFLVVPWIDAAERTSLDGYRRVAAELNAIGERLRREDLRLAYHNHDFEFETFGGDVAGYDVLLAETDPSLVELELDLYWTVHGGRDPLAYLDAFPGRFPLIHAKDRAPDGRMVDVGEGAIDFGAVLARAEQAGIRHVFVEHDEPADPLASIRAGYAHLRAIEQEP